MKEAYEYAANRLADPEYPKYNDETEIADAYEQGYKDAVDKASKWLIDNLPLYFGQINADNTDRFVRIFRKAMEE